MRSTFEAQAIVDGIGTFFTSPALLSPNAPFSALSARPRDQRTSQCFLDIASMSAGTDHSVVLPAGSDLVSHLNEHSAGNGDITDSKELEGVLSKVQNVVSVDIPEFSSVIQQIQYTKKDDVICKALDEILSKLNRCLHYADSLHTAVISSESAADSNIRNQGLLAKVDTLLSFCQSGYSAVLSTILDFQYSLQHTTVQTVILDCLIDQAFLCLTWKRTRQVILDCIPFIYSCCCRDTSNNNNCNHRENSSFLLDAFNELLEKHYNDALVPLLSCLFSNNLFLEEAISLTQRAFASFLKDEDHHLGSEDYSFIIKTLLIYSQTEQEIADIAQQIHVKCITTTSSSDLHFIIGLIVSDLIVQPSPNEDYIAAQNILIIQQGYGTHIATLLRQTMAVSLTIPDLCAILALVIVSRPSPNYSWSYVSISIHHVLRQCWTMEMKCCSNHNKLSSSSIVFVLGKVLQQFVNYAEIENKSEIAQLLLQACAELVVWMLIMTTSTAKSDQKRHIIQDYSFNILYRLLGVSDSLQAWIVEAFCSLISPTMQMQLSSWCTTKHIRLSNPEQICMLSLDFLTFLIKRQQQGQPNERVLQYFTSNHRKMSTLFMQQLANLDNANNLTTLQVHSICFLLSYFIIHIDTNNTKTFLLFLQKLLFNHDSIVENNQICKQCIGILLATQFIQLTSSKSSRENSHEMVCIFDWTCQVLHSSTLDIHAHSNWIGTYGCFFLSICAMHMSGGSSDQNEQQAEELPTALDCYNQCKKILATTGLIQSELSLTENTNHILGFGDVQLPGKPSIRHPLVLCATDLFFTRGESVLSNPKATRHEALVVFVFRLMHTYISLGKHSTKWSPLSWLTMKLQFPLWPICDGKNEVESFWQVWCLRLDEENSESRLGVLDDDNVEPFLQVAWIGCIAISAVLAILHNAQDTPNIKGNIQNLIQFQLARIFTIEMVVEACCRLLLSKRTGKRKTSTVDMTAVFTQVDEIKKCLSNQKLSYLDISLLCTSLSLSINCEDKMAKTIKNFLESDPKRAVDSSFQQEVYLRICLLESLAKAVRLNEANSSPAHTHREELSFLTFCLARNDSPNELLQRADNISCLATIVETTQFFIPWLRRLRRLQRDTHGIGITLTEKLHFISVEVATRLASAHYEVILSVLILGRRMSLGTDQTSMAFSPLLDSFVRSSAVKIRPDLSAEDSLASYQEHFFQFFSKQLEQCEDGSLATQLIDILVRLTYGVNKGYVTRDLVWKAIHTIYPSNVDALSIADSRRPAMEKRVLSSPSDLLHRRISQFQNTALKYFSSSNSVDSVFSLIDKMLCYAKKSSFRQCYVLRHMLFSLWVLLPVNETHSFLRKLFLSLRSFVNKAISDNSKNLKVKHKKRVKNSGIDEETVPGITRNSISPFFEILTTIVVASLVMCLPSADKTVAEVSENVRTPYYDIQNLVSLLIEIIDFFQQTCKVFSKNTVALVLRICIIVIKLMEWQLSICIEWRNSRPLLTEEEEEAGYIDLASVSLLQPLIASYANCASVFAAFCDKIRLQATKTSGKKAFDESLDTDIEGESWIYATFQNSVATLLLRCEKFVVMLRDTSKAHNLRPPRFQNGVVDKVPEQMEDDVCLPPAVKKQHSDSDSLGGEEVFKDGSVNDEDVTSFDFSDDSESFAALGWGGSDEETIESQNDT